ncbi:MAG TPA: hypothetical protein VGM39_23315 [Kofleriaceae bacterium]|jgi:hypothetical protein
MTTTISTRYRSLLLLGLLPFALPLSASLVVAALAIAVYVVIAEPAVAIPVARASRKEDDELAAALTSSDETEVIAAIDTAHAKGRKIPTLALYHPNPTVVRHALETIEDDRDISQLIPILLAHQDAAVRAAAMAHTH